MLTQSQEEILTPIVTEFVAELNGRFREYVSDKFLTALLLHELGRAPGLSNGVSHAARMLEGRNSEAYLSACWIFEGLLEHGCDAGGNGHHVAQDYDAKFKQFAKP